MTAITLKKSWKIWSPGHVIPDMPDNQAALLIARGIAEPHAAAPVTVREAMRAGKDYITKAAKG